MPAGQVDVQHADLARVINIKQGYQLGAETMNFFVGSFISGSQHNPNEQFGIGQVMREPSIVAMTSDYLFGDAHAVMALDYDVLVPDQNPGKAGTQTCLPPVSDTHVCNRIHVLNPNIPLGKCPNQDPLHDEFIEIDTTSNSFRYFDSQTQILYTGNSSSNGRMYVLPYHLLDTQPHSPVGTWLEFITGGILVILGDGGSMVQASDTGGRTLFKTANTAATPRWDELQVPASAIDLAPIPFLARQGTVGRQMYAGRNLVGATHTYELTGPSTPNGGLVYQALLETAHQSSAFKLPATSGKPDKVTVSGIGTNATASELAIPSNGVSKAVQWTFSGPEKKRWVELSGLTMAPGQKVKLQIEHGGYRVRVDNTGGATSATVRVNGGPGAAPFALGSVSIPANGTSYIDFEQRSYGGSGCSLDTQCTGTNQFCDNGTCRTRSCTLTQPWGSVSAVLPGVTSTSGLAVSADGLTAFIARKEAGSVDLYAATRSTASGPFSGLTRLADLSTGADDTAPFLAANGLSLYFTRRSGDGSSNIVLASRTSLAKPFTIQVLPGGMGSNAYQDPFLSPDGNTLLVASNPTSGPRLLYRSTKSSGTFQTPSLLFSGATPVYSDTRPVMNRDGLRLFFGSNRPSNSGDTDGDIWSAARPDPNVQFAPTSPNNLVNLNTSGAEFPVSLSPDGCTLYFASNREHGSANTDAFELYEAHRQSTLSQVTIWLNVTGNGTVGAPFDCSAGSHGTCSATRTIGTDLTVLATRQATWFGNCVPVGAASSSDALLQFVSNGVCNVTFP